MKVKKIKITEKNINMLAGLIQKYFDSFRLKDSSGTELDYIDWHTKEPGSYTFYGGFCYVIAVGNSELKFLQNGRHFVKNAQKAIQIDFPVRDIIRIGDYIHLDGNHFMYGTDHSIYQKMYARDVVRMYSC